jgi:hypothetical protein
VSPGWIWSPEVAKAAQPGANVIKLFTPVIYESS